jgi:membrane associated rhomboid family serine protease
MPQLYGICSLNVASVIFNKAFWQFLTYAFMHNDLQHLIFNMLGIIFFGCALEKAIGSREFTLFYMLSCVFCGIVSFFVYYFTKGFHFFLMGASGALFAVLFAFAVAFPRSSIFVWFVLPVPAPLLIAIYAAMEIFSSFFRGHGFISNSTHIAGFVFAFLYLIVRMGINPIKVWRDAYR